MRPIQFPDIEQLRDRLRSHGYCKFHGLDIDLDDGYADEILALRGALNGGPRDGARRQRFFGRYLLAPSWNAQTFDLGVDSPAFLSSDYRQGEDINPEQRGALRRYEPLPRALWSSRLLREMIFLDLQLLPLADLWRNVGRNPLVVGIHLIRMHALPGQPSVPSPPVPHQDGEPFTCIHLVNRVAVKGAVSQVFRNRPVDNVSRAGELLDEFVLCDLFDTLVVWDREVFHHVTPVETDIDQLQAYRDALIIDFSPLEECKFDARGEIGIVRGAFASTLLPGQTGAAPPPPLRDAVVA